MEIVQSHKDNQMPFEIRRQGGYFGLDVVMHSKTASGPAVVYSIIKHNILFSNNLITMIKDGTIHTMNKNI